MNAAHPAPAIAVIGLGNPILGDDGFGWHVARAVESALPAHTLQLPVTVAMLGVGGLRLMEYLIGYKAALLIDALNTGGAPPGSPISCPLAALPARLGTHLSAEHDTTLGAALQLGRALGAALPERLWVVGVESAPCFEFSEFLTPPVAAALGWAVQTVFDKLHEWDKEAL